MTATLQQPPLQRLLHRLPALCRPRRALRSASVFCTPLLLLLLLLLSPLQGPPAPLLARQDRPGRWRPAC
jgi:hypothetical protein